MMIFHLSKLHTSLLENEIEASAAITLIFHAL
jgi:hypothetical protein